MTEIKRCTRCVMDNASDPTIRFDSEGHCDYCTAALAQQGSLYLPGAEGERRFQALVETLKREGEGKEYDCVMGLSGGLDSSYLCYLGHRRGLRILGVHIDDGFDTDISKENIRKLAEACGIRLRVVAPDAEQFYGLSKAYMRAGVANLAAPQDNVLFAFLYDLMRREKIKYFLSGGNYALECILQRGNTHSAMDVRNIRDINRRFGETKLDKLKFTSYEKRALQTAFLGIQSPRPLNWVDYNRDRAFAELKDFCDFEYYGAKHLENIFTAFVQLYWFPRKFGVDKRTSHLSSMIVSGQMTREEALEQLQKPLYDEAMMDEYIRIVKEKLKISDAEFEQIMAAPAHEHTEYRCSIPLTIGSKLYRAVKRTAK